MFGKIVATALLIGLGIWIITSIVSIVRNVKKKLCKRSMAAAEAQNTNYDKESDQSNSSDVTKE